MHTHLAGGPTGTPGKCQVARGPIPPQLILTLELLVVCVTSSQTSCIVAMVYRPGSVTVTPLFLTEFSDMLDRLATFAEPVLFTGNVNIRMERSTDVHTTQFVDIPACHGLVNCVTSTTPTTHDMGGMLDVVVSRVDLPLPDVNVLDAGLSDHRFLCWPAPLSRPTPVYTTATCRPWSRLDPAEFTVALQSSLLNQPDIWTNLNVDDLARLYDSEITSILNRTVPVHSAISTSSFRSMV